MKKLRLTDRKYFLGFIIFTAVIIGISGQDAFGQTSSFTIDLTGQPNTTTFPYGICYDGTQYVYVTIFASGELARVDVNTLAVTFFDDNTASAGQDWYSALCHSNGKVYVNEKDNGKMQIFDTATGLFTHIPIPENISGGVISYTTSYNDAPQNITVNESCVGAGNRSYNFGFDSFGEIKSSNGFVWQVIDYKYNFSANSETCGASDVEFHGIARINPSDNSVTRYTISGAQNLRGIDVDSVDSTILWITDNTANKIFKFDTNTNTVTQTISLPPGSKAMGITDDTTNLYVASNKIGNGIESGKILNVVKSDGTVSTIDTGAIIANTESGVFEVDIARGFIMWSDQSQNIGTVNLSTSAKTTTRTTDASSNHFGVVVGDKYWVAGKGSAVITQTSFPSGGGGDGDSWQSKPTFGISYLTNNQIVNDGFGYGVYNNTKTKTITNNFHTDFEMVEIPTGIPYSFFAKGYFANDPWIQEFCFGIPEAGKGYLAESCVEVYFDSGYRDKKQITDVNIVQKSQVIGNVTAIHTMASCEGTGDKGVCDKTGITVTFNEPLKDKVMMIKGIDYKRKTTETYLNKGFDVNGKQFTSLPDNMIPSPVKYAGLIKVTQSEKYSNLWISDDGKIFERNSFGSFTWINQSFQRHQDTDDMRDRSHSEFSGWKQTQAINAKSIFDSEKIQAVLPDYFAYDFPDVDSRTQFLIDHNLLHLRK